MDKNILEKVNILDAGTTWSKVISFGDKKFCAKFHKYLKNEENGKSYFILPSKILRNSLKEDFKFNLACGHMLSKYVKEKDRINEALALAYGTKNIVDGNATVLDLGSRDAKWIRFEGGKFKDLDWNTSCASSTGATVEMLLKFYELNKTELKFINDKYNITCGIFGLEKIMDDISNGNEPSIAISKFLHGIAFNAWVFSRKPKDLFLSGGFCDFDLFIAYLQLYTNVTTLGRFTLANGLWYCLSQDNSLQ